MLLTPEADADFVLTSLTVLELVTLLDSADFVNCGHSDSANFDLLCRLWFDSYSGISTR